MEQMPNFEYDANNEFERQAVEFDKEKDRLSPASEFYQRHGFHHDEDEYELYNVSEFHYMVVLDDRLSPATEFYERDGFHHDGDEYDPFEHSDNEFDYMAEAVPIQDNQLSPATEFNERHGYYYGEDDTYEEEEDLQEDRYREQIECKKLRQRRIEHGRNLADYYKTYGCYFNGPACVYPKPPDVQTSSNTRLLAVKQKKNKKADGNGYATQEACNRSNILIPIEPAAVLYETFNGDDKLNEDIAENGNSDGNVSEKNIVMPAEQDFSLDFSFSFNDETLIVQLQELQRNRLLNHNC